MATPGKIVDTKPCSQVPEIPKQFWRAVLRLLRDLSAKPGEG